MADAAPDSLGARRSIDRLLYVCDRLSTRLQVSRTFGTFVLEEITSFGDGGRQPGQFYGVHSIATDSQGNIYATETYEGKRVQRFVLRGMRQVTRKGQRTVWPQ